MAEIIDNIEDDTTQLDSPQGQIEQGQQEPVSQEDDGVPAKFKGKTAKEIADSYINLESELGRKAQEIGELRRLTDQIIQQQLSQKKEARNEEPAVDVRDDDIFIDPKGSIDRLITNHPKIKEYEKAAQEQIVQSAMIKAEAAKKAFTEKHPDFTDILGDQEFHGWVSSSPVRQSLLRQAHNNYDYYAGDELFSTWKEIKKMKSAQAEKTKDELKATLKAASVPSGSGSSEPSTKIFRRVDIINLKIKDPARYEAMSDEILKAYAEGRVR